MLQIQQSPASSPTPPLTKMSVSDKKKLFESAMEEHLKPSPKPGENTYFLSHAKRKKIVYLIWINVTKKC